MLSTCVQDNRHRVLCAHPSAAHMTRCDHDQQQHVVKLTLDLDTAVAVACPMFIYDMSTVQKLAAHSLDRIQ